MEREALAPKEALARSLSPIQPSEETGLATRPEVPAQNPAEVLAALMDFPGSVALAELLDAPPGPGRRHPDAQARGRQLIHDIRARVTSLESLALKPLLGRRAPAMPSPNDLLEALDRHGIRSDRSTPVVEALADELGAPLRSALSLSLRQGQAHLATLRWELTHDIRSLGSAAERLERIDAGLSRSIQAKMGELLDRMEHAAHLTFVRACAHAVQELPPAYTDEDLAPWCAADGWFPRYADRCVRISRALFGHLRRNLEGFVRAAVHAEET